MEKKIGKWWISCGYSFKQISIGITINKYNLSIDLLFVWLGVDFNGG